MAKVDKIQFRALSKFGWVINKNGQVVDNKVLLVRLATIPFIVTVPNQVDKIQFRALSKFGWVINKNGYVVDNKVLLVRLATIPYIVTVPNQVQQSRLCLFLLNYKVCKTQWPNW